MSVGALLVQPPTWPSELEFAMLPEATTPRQKRFWSRVREDESGCWVWTGATNQGYGTFWARPEFSTPAAHRISYEWLVGPIPVGLVIDHLCRVRNCVNPSHLEPVTIRTNILRGDLPKTHCPKGHEYTPENTVRNGKAQRKQCHICKIRWQREYIVRRRLREQAAIQPVEVVEETHS